MDHVVELGDGKISIANQWIVHCMSLGFFDVFHPVGVIADGVRAQANDLTVAFFEFRLQAGHIAQLGRANWSEILRMREQNSPAIPYPIMKIDCAFRCWCRKIRSFFTDMERHGSPPPEKM